MAITKTIGGDRLASGGKMTTSLSAYGRTTVPLSRFYQNTMGIGTLNVAYMELGLMGDVWEMEINASVYTHPTVSLHV